MYNNYRYSFSFLCQINNKQLRWKYFYIARPRQNQLISKRVFHICEGVTSFTLNRTRYIFAVRCDNNEQGSALIPNYVGINVKTTHKKCILWCLYWMAQIGIECKMFNKVQYFIKNTENYRFSITWWHDSSYSFQSFYYATLILHGFPFY